MKKFREVAALLALISATLHADAAVRPEGFAFNGVSNHFITPNGDGKNENVAFKFTNPRDAAGSIKIFDLRGRCLEMISIAPGDTSKIWDGRANGQPVATGVYLFVINVENVASSGALVVIR